MKILLMNNGYLAHTVSGGTNHLIGLAEAYAEDHDVSFIVPAPAADLLPAGVARIGYPSRYPRSLVGMITTYLTRIVKAARLARREPADVVLALSLLYDVLPAVVHRRTHGSRLGIFVFHLIPRRKGHTQRRRPQFATSYLAQRIAIRLYASADVVFAGNSGVVEELKELGIPEGRILVQHPAIDTESILEARPIHRYDALFIGRMVARKGIYDLVEAARGLDLRVGFVGEGEERARLQRLITEHGLGDQFEVTGHLSATEAHGLLRGCRCLVLPSYEEGYGMVIAEAIAAGRPVITYELPHYRDAFGSGPIYVPVGDKAALRSALAIAAKGGLAERAIRNRYREVRVCDKAEVARRVLEAMTDHRQRHAPSRSTRQEPFTKQKP